MGSRLIIFSKNGPEVQATLSDITLEVIKVKSYHFGCLSDITLE